MCFTFLKAQGSRGWRFAARGAISSSTCRTLLERSEGKIGLPPDIVVASELTDDAQTQVVAADAIPPGTKVWTSAQRR